MILFIIPPFYRFLGSANNGINLGVSYIAAYLESRGHEALIYNADKGTEYADQNQLFENEPIIEGHKVFDEIREVIESARPDYIGLTMFTASYKTCQIIADIAKELGVMVIVGGPHPTITKVEGFDYIVSGEGEYQVADILEGKPCRQAFIKDLDILPYPKRDYLNGCDDGYVITGRGCPYSCIFCASQKIWNGKVRLRSVGSVVDEISTIKSDFISFSDETFTLVRDRTIELCKGLSKTGKSWKCDTRADRIDYELAVLMKKSGCVRIKMGIESGSARILDLTGKRLNKDKIRRSVYAIKKAQIPITAYLMVGFPTETEQDIEQTIEFAKELDCDFYSLSIATPYPGTKMHDMVLNGNEANYDKYYHQSKYMLKRNNIDDSLFKKFLSVNAGK